MLCQKYIHYTKKINLIVDEYDGEVLDEAKRASLTNFQIRKCLHMMKKKRLKKHVLNVTKCKNRKKDYLS